MAITSDARPHTAERTGIGLRLPHIAEVVATRPPVGWLEIHPENFLANPHGLELLTDLARDYPISVHTVGISIGSADGIDRDHLMRLRGAGRSTESGPRLWTPRMVHGGWRVSQRSLAVAVHGGDASRGGRASRGSSGRPGTRVRHRESLDLRLVGDVDHDRARVSARAGERDRLSPPVRRQQRPSQRPQHGIRRVSLHRRVPGGGGRGTPPGGLYARRR